jgi:hypothetical protein
LHIDEVALLSPFVLVSSSLSGQQTGMFSIARGVALSSLMGAVASAATTIPYIDPTLKPSVPTAPIVSEVDTSLETYDRIVLKVDGQPFFYNSVQLRADKMASIWNMTDAEIQPFFQLAANDGLTVVSSQIRWIDIQPDSVYNATESTYVQGGSYDSTNFASNESMLIRFDGDVDSNQALTYLKFDFSDYSLDEISAAKIRFWINAAPLGGASFSANLYGITNNSWSASEITWNSAPNHDGIDISGDNGTNYWLTAVSPSWDPINMINFYDFDASDFIINHCPDRIASFIFQPQVNITTSANGATLDGAKGTYPPQLTVSSVNSWDYTRLDNLVGWAQDAGIKFEIIWFGSDSTSETQDTRVPYFVFRHVLVEKVQSDGTVVPALLKDLSWGSGLYTYLSDKNDLTLRALEKAAIKAMMNHIAKWDAANGNLKTVVGVDVGNENSVTHIQGIGDTVYHNPATWGAYVNFTSLSAWIARTEWEYTVNLANGVKESNYPVWTRTNTFTTAEDPNLVYNEYMRPITGTSVDFVGLDPYSTNTTLMYTYGHQTTTFSSSVYDWSQGSNLPMVMENGGQYTNAEYLNLAALAGGAVYNIYELMGPDNFGYYYPAGPHSGNFTPIERGAYVSPWRTTRKLLNQLSADLATKRPSGANGTRLVFFNPLGDSTITTHSGTIQKFPVSYTSSSNGVGIGVVRSDVALVFATTRDATFVVSGVTTYGISAVEYGYYNSAGNFVANGTYPYTSSGTSITIDADQGILIHVEFKTAFPLV